jgi:hypothetical protein
MLKYKDMFVYSVQIWPKRQEICIVFTVLPNSRNHQQHHPGHCSKMFTTLKAWYHLWPVQAEDLHGVHRAAPSINTCTVSVFSSTLPKINMTACYSLCCIDTVPVNYLKRDMCIEQANPPFPPPQVSFTQGRAQNFSGGGGGGGKVVI